MSRKPEAVVVGAGLGGLATALRLAHTGWHVTVLERSSRAGGKMNRWQAGGYTFDTGPSLLTMPEVFGELFACAGCRIEDHLKLVRLDPVARYIYPDGTGFLAGQSLPLWQRELERCFPEDQAGFFRLLALGGRLFELSRETFFARAPQEPPQPEMLKAVAKMPVAEGWGNYHRTVSRHIRDPRLVQYFDRYATYVGSSPYAAPATLLAIPYLEHAHGAYYVEGGLYQLVTKLVELLEEAGVQLRLGAEVTGFEVTGGRLTAVRINNDELFETNVTVFNGDAATIPQLLGHPEPAADQRSLSGVVLLLGLRRRLPELQHHTVYFSNSYEREFQQLFGSSGIAPEFPSDPTVYVNIPSLSDRSLAPEGGESVFIMANCPADGNWSDGKTTAARQRIFQRLDSSGFPDVTSDIELEQVWAPQDFERTYGMPGGAIYGQVSHGWRNTFFRPANRDRRIRGLYRVGGSSHPGGGTPTVLMSARIVQELIDRHEH